MVSIRALERDSISGCERWKTHWLPNSRAPARKPSAQPDTRLLPHTAAPVRASASVAGSGILPRRTIRRRRSGWRARSRGRARRAIRSPATGAAFGACGFFPALHGSFRAASPSARARLHAPSSLRPPRIRPVRPRRAPRIHCSTASTTISGARRSASTSGSATRCSAGVAMFLRLFHRIRGQKSKEFRGGCRSWRRVVRCVLWRCRYPLSLPVTHPTDGVRLESSSQEIVILEFTGPLHPPSEIFPCLAAEDLPPEPWSATPGFRFQVSRSTVHRQTRLID